MLLTVVQYVKSQLVYSLFRQRSELSISHVCHKPHGFVCLFKGCTDFEQYVLY
jgi:hypothetical protein